MKLNGDTWVVLISPLVHQLQKLPGRTRAVLLTCIYGLVAGCMAVAFQVVVSWLYRHTLVSFSHGSTATFLTGSFLTVVCTAMISGYLLNSFCQEASGSGIPQLKLSFWKDFGVVPWRAVWVKFVAGALSIGGGSSLGREGPSVYLAGGAASNVAGPLGEAKQSRRAATAAGAAAGLAAAFNTPLAATTFVLEEIIQDLNSRFLGGVLLASVIGALVVHGLVGKQPAFSLGVTDSPAWTVYVLTPLVAAAAALAGVAFQRLTLGLRRRQTNASKIPAWLRPSIGALIAWSLGAAVFLKTGLLGVFSLGYDDLSAGLNHELSWKIAGLLLVTKLAATIACYGFGGCGGIFSPTLFFGGMCGIFFGGLAGPLLHLTTADQLTLTVVGMSACLGAVVHAPVTGILIVFEMTHEFSLVPALMLGALVSQAVSHKLGRENFYEAILVQDGHQLERVIPPRDLQSWQQLPVSAIANFQPILINDLEANALHQMLDQHPYNYFPVVIQGQPTGILARAEGHLALKEGRRPKLEKFVTCQPSQTIRELQGLLIESPAHMVVLLDRPGGTIIGLITLHDLLRTQMSMAKSSVE